MSEHTPGPWRIGRIFWKGSPHAWTTVYPRGSRHQVAESLALADGYLVAAAPDLLAALKACVEQLSAYEERHWLGEAWRTRIGLREDLDAARRAIAKAEGRHGGR